MEKVVARFMLGALVLMAIVPATACKSVETKTGVLTGVATTISLDSAVSGQADEMKLDGGVYVTLDDGEEVLAYYPAEMEDDLRGGQTLEIEKTQVDGKDRWVVARIVAEP